MTGSPCMVFIYQLVNYFLSDFWASVAVLWTIAAMAYTSGHAILHKRHTHAAIGWVCVIWFVPVLGMIFYFFFGINRIERKARSLRGGRTELPHPEDRFVVTPDQLKDHLPARKRSLATLFHVTGTLTDFPLVEGNSIEPLLDGDEAFPAMLQAIDGARHTVSLCTYIFDNDPVGQRFRDALRRAMDRGVQVRILVDEIGAHYTYPSIVHILQQDGLPAACFMKSLAPWKFRYFNLRNHRKILVVDGATAFTGGINIRQGHLLSAHPPHPVKDLHFRVQGPVVSYMQHCFADDWVFATNEILSGEGWFPDLRKKGPVMARAIADGPDENYDKLHGTILAALSCASRSIRIVTPYFLPDSELISALGMAALKGVDVEIILPGQNNLPMVKWASTALLGQVLQHGCKIFLAPPPFDHTKLMVVDRAWVLLGSGNWDPRSLRLNFEFNIECYSPDLAKLVLKLTDRNLVGARPMSLKALEARPLPIKLRDAFFKLLSPYL